MRIAVITGASSGIGREFASTLAERSDIDEIWAIARNAGRLEQAAREIDFPIKTVQADVSDPASLGVLEKMLKEQQPEVVWLINNAGYAKFCAFADMDISQWRKMTDTNCGGVLTMTALCLPYMPKSGKIVNLASVAAYLPLPYAAVYAASKAFVRSFSRALARELKPRGITVCAVSPYWTDTGFFDVAHAHAGQKKITKYKVMYRPSDIARRAVKDAARGKDTSSYGFVNRTLHLFIKLLPARVVIPVWMRMQGLKGKKQK